MTQDIHFNCPSCQRPLSALASEAGQKVACSHCNHQPVTVPHSLPVSATVAANGCGVMAGTLFTLFIVIPIFAVIGFLIIAAFSK